MKKVLVTKFNLENVVVNHLGIDGSSQMSPWKKYSEKEVFKMVSISNLVESKGLHINIQAINRLKKLGFNIIYDIYGEGEYKFKLLNLIKKLNLDDIINCFRCRVGMSHLE